MTLLNVTVAGNSGSSAIDNIATLNTRNSIFSNAPGGNCSAALTSQGSNLESADECGLHAAGDQVGKEPMLGPLADNGGQTDTLALLSGSPAIDRGTACPPTDQRGVARPQGAACDVGAFELVPAIATPSNEFKFGRLKRNKVKGTAVLFVTLPGPGTISLGKSRGVVGVPGSKTVSAAGLVGLRIRPRAFARRKLNHSGQAQVIAKVTYTPAGGVASTKAKTIKLIKRR
jgi:hypothetical protein